MTEVDSSPSLTRTMDLPRLPDTTQPPNPPVSSTSPSNDPVDAVSSLRAAALSSLRLKRKRASSTQPSKVMPAARPNTSQNGLVLDYGNDESNIEIPSGHSPTGSSTLTANGHRSIKSPASEDDNREEGEISDEELPTSDNKSPQSLSATNLTPQMNNSTITVLESSSRVRSSPRTPLVTRNGLPSGLLPEYESGERPLIDEDHVRPGLSSMLLISVIKLPS